MVLSFNIKPFPGIKILRLILFILICLNSICLTAQVSVLNRYISLEDTICRLDTALFILEQKSGGYFSYNSDIIASGSTVKLESPGDTLKLILRKIIPDENIKFRVVDQLIVIYSDIPASNSGTINEVDILSETFILKGRIIDRSSGDPIPFATISIQGTQIGTIANSAGDFIFKYPGLYLEDSVVISCMGFKFQKVRLGKTDTVFTEIFLQPDFIPIQEVIIRKSDPIYLMHSAISRIPENYFTGPINLTTFYRESVRKGNKYIIISEAILEIFRSAFNEQYPFDQVKMVKGRKNVDINRTDTVTLRLKAGLQTSLFLDIVRNKPEFFNEEFTQYYSWDMTDIILDDDRYVYVIAFKQHLYTQPPHYEGKIYIDMESLAIRAFEFNINPETIDEAARYLVIHKPRDFDVIPVSAQYYVRYREDNGKFYLSYILSDNVFRIRKKTQILSRTFQTLTEMAVTNIRTEDVTRFRQKETTDISDLFINQVGGYDEKFWGEYNYIQPDEPLEEALRRISTLMEKKF